MSGLVVGSAAGARAARRRCGWLSILAVACVPAVQAPVSEAFDVPPPPGQRTLELGPAALRGEPGAVVVVEGVQAEVVDRREVEDGAVLTVYVDEEHADRWLAGGAVDVSRPGACGIRP